MDTRPRRIVAYSIYIAKNFRVLYLSALFDARVMIMMNIDPTKNVVVFKVQKPLRKEETVKGETLTRDLNGVQKVWDEVSTAQSIKTRHVREIYSEWEPSDEDKAFLNEHFAGVKVSYSFERPTSDSEWEQAFAAAREQLAETARKQHMPDTQLLPVLRDFDDLAGEVLQTAITPELAVYLANVGVTPRGTLGIDYVMQKAVTEQGADLQALWEQAFKNVMKGLAVNGAEDNGHPLLVINREQGLAAAAVGLPDFTGRIAGMLNAPQFYVAIPDPNTLLAVDANSPIAEKIQQVALSSEYNAALAFTPCVLLVDGEVITLHKRR
jgi:hypothetical protein